MRINWTLTLSFIFVFLLFFLPLVDTDFGWHLRYGQYFLEHHEFLKNNTFTYFLPGYYWPSSFTFYEILVAIVFKFWGLLGLSVLYGVLGGLGYWLFKKIIQNDHLSLPLFLSIFILGYDVFNLGFRAQFLTFIFLEIELFILLRKPKWIYYFPIFFALWANTHGAFVLGLAVLGIYTVSKVKKANLGELGRLGVITILSFGAPLMNPYGIGVYQEAFLHADYPLNKLIAEWVSPDWGIRLLAIGLLGGLGWLMSKELKKNIFLFLCLLLFTYLCITARRFVPLWGLVAAICFAEVYQAKWFKFLDKFHIEYIQRVALCFGILILLLSWVPATIKMDTSWDSYCEGVKHRLDYPCKAVEYVKSHPIVGDNVFTAYEWGGFLEWQMPEYKYFSDGRMVAWPTPENKSPYTIYLEIIQAQSGYDAQLEKYGTDWLLIGAGTFLDIELKDNPQGWKEVYRDEIATIYTKI